MRMAEFLRYVFRGPPEGAPPPAGPIGPDGQSRNARERDTIDEIMERHETELRELRDRNRQAVIANEAAFDELESLHGQLRREIKRRHGDA